MTADKYDFFEMVAALNGLELPELDLNFVNWMVANPHKRGRNMKFLNKLYVQHIEEIQRAQNVEERVEEEDVIGSLHYSRRGLFQLDLLPNPQLQRYLRSQGWRVDRRDHKQYAPPTLENYHWLTSNFQVDISPEVRNYVLETNSWLEGEISVADGPLYDFQELAVKFLMSRDRALLCLSPGLGKTLVSAYASSHKGDRRTIVVCPKSLIYYWQSELKKWEQHFQRPIVCDYFTRPPDVQAAFYQDEDCHYFFITNPERAREFPQEWMEIIADTLILDESILYKNRNSARSKKVKSIANATPTVWELSGAPVTRYLDDMWHQLHLLDGKAYSSYWRFADRYCLVDENQWGRSIVGNRKNAARQLKEWHKDYYLSITQDEVLDLPDWLIEEVDVPMTTDQNDIYKRLIKDLVISLDDLPSGRKLRVENKLGLVMRTAQVASNPMLVGAKDTSGKWDSALDMIEYLPGPIIVWCNYVRTVEEMHTRIKASLPDSANIAMMCGYTPVVERQASIDALQAGKLDILITNNVASHGFTMTKARSSIYVERDFSGSFFQSLHRIRRIGTEQSPVVMLLRSVKKDGKPTIDHVIHRILDYRTSQVRDLTVGMLKGLDND